MLPRHVLNFRAGIAEFLLLLRLKAKARLRIGKGSSVQRAQAAGILERAAHIVAVTCKNWFMASDGKKPPQRTPL